MPPILSAAAVVLCLALGAFADDLHAVPPGHPLDDARLQPLKDLDGYFPFTPPASAEAWSQRAEQVRQQIRVSLGLWPQPSKTPLNPVIHSLLDRGDYTVEKVFLESRPGFFVTGNLYRPKDAGGKHPGVLCPYGHWADGRFLHAPDDSVKKDLATGAEQLENAARSHVQARCVQLARMGCVVFHYDMIGKADCMQISDEIAHGFQKQRPEMNGAEAWGFFSPQAEAQGQSIMGLQTWNSIRALDFLTELQDVDATRIGVTGASGGATQTMMLVALDPRVTAAFPAVMVSTGMQGGCTCENASGLRVGTGNVEIASLFAPKPMAMTCANDWTKEMETKGFPEMQKLWTLLGHPENVQLTAALQFPHNYNAVSRAAMYAWFNEHLGLKLPPKRLVERDFPLLTRAEMSVWDATHPAPAGGPDFERRLLREWRDDVQAQMQTPEAQRAILHPAWETLLRRRSADARDVTYSVTQKQDHGTHWLITGVVRNETFHEEIPAVFLHPKEWKGATVLWLHDKGKQGLFTERERLQPTADVAKLLEAGISVIGVDLTRQGEAQIEGDQPASAPAVKNPREAAAYTLAYNEPLLVQRVHDVLTLRRLVQLDQHQARTFGLVALDRTAPIAAAARFALGESLDAAVLDTSFRFQDVMDIHDPRLVPGAARYGDLPGLLRLGTSPLWTPEPNTPPASGASLEWLLKALRGA